MLSEKSVKAFYEERVGLAAEEYLKFKHSPLYGTWVSQSLVLGAVLGYSYKETDNKIAERIREKSGEAKEAKEPVVPFILVASC